nr:hypothetical protein [Pandoravirus massiliensis]
MFACSFGLFAKNKRCDIDRRKKRFKSSCSCGQKGLSPVVADRTCNRASILPPASRGDLIKQVMQTKGGAALYPGPNLQENTHYKKNNRKEGFARYAARPEHDNCFSFFCLRNTRW